MNRLIKPLIRCLLTGCLAGSAHAGLSVQKTTAVFKGQSAEERPDVSLSLYPGKASFLSRGTPETSGILGRGSVADYLLFGSRTGSDPIRLKAYAQGVPQLMDAPEVKFYTRPTGDFLDVWTDTDPGASFSTPPDFKGNSDIRTYTSVCAQDITGTIDISDLSEGSVYLLYGSFKDSVTVSASLSGTGLPAQTAQHTEPHGDARIHWWITEFKFSDAQQYDTFTYHYANADEDGSRAHFIGVFLDAEVPLGTIGLIN